MHKDSTRVEQISVEEFEALKEITGMEEPLYVRQQELSASTANHGIQEQQEWRKVNL